MKRPASKLQGKTVSPHSHPAHELIYDSVQEVYCFTEDTYSTFNILTKSQIFDQLHLKFTKLNEEPPWLLLQPVVDEESSQRVFRGDISEISRTISCEYISETYQRYVKIYTDGSKSPSGAGFSFYIPSFGVKEAMTCSKCHSPYCIELLAIQSALSWVLRCSTQLVSVAP